MSKRSRLAVGVGLLGAAVLLPSLAPAWWGGGDRWRDRDYWYDRPYHRYGGPGYWGGGPWGWRGPGYWGGGPWGWGGYPGYYGHPYGAAPADTQRSAPQPLPE